MSISRNTENIEGYDPAIDSPRSPLSNADMNVTKYFYISLKKYPSFNEALKKNNNKKKKMVQ